MPDLLSPEDWLKLLASAPPQLPPDETAVAQPGAASTRAPFAVPAGPTHLDPLNEMAFRQWVATNKVPFDPSATTPQDYDMRGYWQAQQSGDPMAAQAENRHFPDLWKLPAHKTFSNQSIFAGPGAPAWSNNQLATPGGRIIADERPPAAAPAPPAQFKEPFGGELNIPPPPPRPSPSIATDLSAITQPSDQSKMLAGYQLPSSPGFPGARPRDLPDVLGDVARYAGQMTFGDQRNPAPQFTRGAAPYPEIPGLPKTLEQSIAELAAQRGNVPSAAEIALGFVGGPSGGAAVPMVGAAVRGAVSGAARSGLGNVARTAVMESRLPPPAATTSFGRAQEFTQTLPKPVIPEPTGSPNPLANKTVTFQGKQPAQFTPEDWQAFGQHYGTDKPLGPLSPLEAITDPKTGKVIQVPGGLQGEWTYYDLLHMKANPLNPNEISPELHTALQQKIGRTMTPVGGSPSDAQVWNGLIFGMTSPANPLFSNQLAQSRLRLRDPAMLNDLASSIPWKAGDTVSPEVRMAANRRIADRFGLGTEESGGLGVRGNADYTRIAELAQMFQKNPDFFRKQSGEEWPQFVERLASQVPGLGMKTGSFGGVWQDPAMAAVSAIDRHMARELEQRGGLFASQEQRANWEQRAVARYNKGRDPADQVADFQQLAAKPGTDSLIGGMLLEHVGATLEPKMRLAGGQLNPNLPPHLAQTQWVVEPQKAAVMGEAYKRALELNQRIADEHGLNLFGSQWMTWDRIRQRFEPHENMFPGLEKTPAPSIEQLRGVQAAHAQTGHKATAKTEEGQLRPTKPLVGSPSQMGYLGLGATLGGISQLKKKEEDQ